MIVVEVRLLPPDTPEDDLRELRQDIVNAAVGIDGVENYGGERDVVTLFPNNLLPNGNGLTIIVEISKFVINRGRPGEVTARVARRVGEAVSQHFPNARVRSYAESLNEIARVGSWSSGE